MNNEYICPECGQKYYLSNRTLLFNHVFLLVSYIVLMAVINLFDIGGTGFCIGMVMLLIVWIVSFPSTVQLTAEPHSVLDRKMRAVRRKKEDNNGS